MFAGMYRLEVDCGLKDDDYHTVCIFGFICPDIIFPDIVSYDGKRISESSRSSCILTSSTFYIKAHFACNNSLFSLK